MGRKFGGNLAKPPEVTCGDFNLHLKKRQAMATIDRALDRHPEIGSFLQRNPLPGFAPRILEEKRKSLASLANEAESEYQSGKAFTGLVEDILKELDKDDQ